MGSTLKMDYTLLGDAVNMASRLEGLTRQLPYALAICANFKQHCQESWQFVALGEHSVKGKRNSIEVYSIDNSNSYQNIQNDQLATLIRQRLKIS
jgi:class 3 adenylate cyclase